MGSKNPRVNVTFDEEVYEQLKNISDRQGRSMSDVVREYAVKGLNGTVGAENINMISQVVREQVKSVIDPSVERICSLGAKACVMSAASTYLGAETISRFVPAERQMDVKEAYDAARLKAVRYVKSDE